MKASQHWFCTRFARPWPSRVEDCPAPGVFRCLGRTGMLSTISLSLRPAYVRQYDDGTRPKDVTVDERHRLAEPFEKYRSHLHAVAYRMLGSFSEADEGARSASPSCSRSERR